jgi:uncharacterized protein YecE (DUF72 family)
LGLQINSSRPARALRVDTENHDRRRLPTIPNRYSYAEESPQGWAGIFYPKGASRRLGDLELYASYFDLVKITSSFYRSPTRAMAQAWAQKTADDFKFAVKAWQKFTHPIQLGSGTVNPLRSWEPFDAHDVELFSDGLKPLADTGKGAVLLFQFPAGVHCVSENLDRLEGTLAAFKGFPKVVELRHRSWSDHESQTRDSLNRWATGWAFIDEPKFAASVKQTIVVHSDFVYLRLHGRNHGKWWRMIKRGSATIPCIRARRPVDSR